MIIHFVYLYYFIARQVPTHFREQDILPLPCIRTIRRYLSLVKPQCGFDDNFFLLLKKKWLF